MKDILIKGAFASLPLVLAEHAYLYLANRSSFSEGSLTYIKPTILGMFLFFAVGIPVLLSLKDREIVSLSLKRMIAVIAISWGLFVCATTLTLLTVYPLHKEVDPTILSTLFDSCLMFVVGFPPLALTCSLFAFVGKRLLSKKEAGNE